MRRASALGGAGFGGVLVSGRGEFGPAFGWQAEMLLGGGSAGTGGFVFAEPNVGLDYRIGYAVSLRINAGYFVTSESR